MLGYLQLINKGESMNTSKSTIEVYSNGYLEQLELIKEEIKRYTLLYSEKTNSPRVYSSEYDVCFVPEDEKVLGFCRKTDNGYLIGISEKLAMGNVSWDYLSGVVGHETAHMLVASNIGDTEAHGEAFKEVCRYLGIEEFSKTHAPKEVASSTNIMNRIKKLLALSESNNTYESQSALLKARKIMMEHSISANSIDESKKIYRVKLAEYGRYTMDYTTISYIVKQITSVYMLRSSLHGKKVLYAHGTLSECKIAEYLFDYLTKELNTKYEAFRDTLYDARGAKKSFYLGVYDGMQKRFENDTDVTISGNALMLSEQNKNSYLAKQYVYSDLRVKISIFNAYAKNMNAVENGRSVGKNLQIHHGIGNTSQSSMRYLG